MKRSRIAILISLVLLIILLPWGSGISRVVDYLLAQQGMQLKGLQLGDWGLSTVEGVSAVLERSDGCPLATIDGLNAEWQWMALGVERISIARLHVNVACLPESEAADGPLDWQPLLTQLPKAKLEIDALTLSIAEQSYPAMQLRLANQQPLTMSLQGRGIELRAMLNDSQVSWQATLDQQLLQSLSLQLSVEVTGRVNSEGTVQIPSTLNLSDLSDLSLQASIEVNGEWQSLSGPTNIQGGAVKLIGAGRWGEGRAELRWQEGAEVTLNTQFAAPLDTFDRLTLVFPNQGRASYQQGEWAVDGDLRVVGRELTAELSDIRAHGNLSGGTEVVAELSASGTPPASLKLPNMAVKGVVSMQVAEQSPWAQWVVEIEDGGELKTGHFEQNGLSLASAALRSIGVTRIASEGTVVKASGELTSTVAQLRFAGSELPEVRLEQQWQLDGSTLSADGEVALSGLPASITHSSSIDLTTQQGQTNLRLVAASLKPLQPAIEKIIKQKLPVKLTQGSAEVNAALSLAPERVIGVATLQLRQVSGEYDEMPFLDLNGALRARYDGKQWFSAPQAAWPNRITLGGFNPGTPITQLETQLHFSGSETLQSLSMSQLRAELLEGSVQAEQLPLYGTASRGELVINGWNLERVVALEAHPQVKVTGRIDGRLPVALTERGHAIEQGKIWNQGEGTIRLREHPTLKELAKNNPSIAKVTEVLSHLDYQTLEGSCSITPEGDMQLGLRIEGHNPDVSLSRPVHFTYNHEENLYDLLKSLRITGDLEKQLVERYGR